MLRARKAALTLLGVSLGVLVFAASPASAAFKTTYLRQLTSASTPAKEFQLRADSVAVDDFTGDTLVADSRNGLVQEFDPLGNYLTTWDGANTPTESFGFGKVAVAANNVTGKVYVADTSDRVVDVLESTGAYATTWNGSNTPAGSFGELDAVAVDQASGDVYISDLTNEVIDVFASSGEYLFQIAAAATPQGIFGAQPPEVLDPAVDDATGDVLIAYGASSDSSYRTAIFEFNGAGNYLDTWYGANTPERSFEVPGSLSIAISDATGDVFAADTGNKVVDIFDSSGEYQTSQIGADTPSGTLGRPKGVAIDQATGDIYVSTEVEGEEVVDVFSASVIPDVIAAEPSSLQSTSVILNGAVNPDGVQVDECRFEYGTETSYGQSVPCAPSQLGLGRSPVPVSAELSGLQPDTLYHFRLDAGNANGTNAGRDLTFFTETAPLVEDESSFGIGSAQATVRAQLDPAGAPSTYRVEYGTTVAYGSSTADVGLGDARSGVGATALLAGLQPNTEYHYRFVVTNSLGTTFGGDETFRTVAGSLTSASGSLDNRVDELVSSPANEDREVYVPANEGEGEDQGSGAGVWSGYSVQASKAGDAVVYVGDPSPGGSGSSGAGFGNQYMAVRGSPGGWVSKVITPTAAPIQFGVYTGFTNDLTVGVVNSSSHSLLSPDAPASCEEVLYSHTMGHDGYQPLFTGGPANTGEACHDFNGARFAGASSDGAHILFSVPAALTSDAPGHEEQDLYEWEQGKTRVVSVLPDGKPVANAKFGSPGSSLLSNVVSTDGSRVFWTDLNDQDLYVREGNGTPAARTVQVGPEGAEYAAASADGSLAFFTWHGDLYRFDVDAEQATNLTPSGEVQGVAGARSDGTYVYFVADAALAAGSSAGQPNLYVYHEGATRFIAVLSEADSSSWTGHSWDHENDVIHSAEVSSGGDDLVFTSHAHVTSYDNGGENEVYVYDAKSSDLACVSCAPNGAPVTGGGAFLSKPTENTRLPRWISEDGSRVFFDTHESLVPQDTNGQIDVYEWEQDGAGSCLQTGGCISLLSGGQAAGPSFFLDASGNGGDAFFTTPAQLVSEDQNDNVDVYDARVEGYRPISAPSCSGTGCQGVPPSSPIFATPSSVTFNGLGNFAAMPASTVKAKTKILKCKKGSVKRAGKCAKQKRYRKTARKKSKHVRGSSKRGEEVMVRRPNLRVVRLTTALLMALMVAGAFSAAASASTGPGWEVTTNTYPTNLAPGGRGIVQVDVFDIGAAAPSGPIVVTDTLPEGLTATNAGATIFDVEAGGETGTGLGVDSKGPWECSGATVVTCKLESGTEFPVAEGGAGGGAPMQISIAVRVDPNANGSATNTVTVAGGGSPTPADASSQVIYSSSPSGFGFTNSDAWFSNADGTSDTQAGSHPYAATFIFHLATILQAGSKQFGLAKAAGEVNTIESDLPPGLVGDPHAVPQCTRQQLNGRACPPASQIGIIRIGVQSGALFPFRVYNMVPPAGVPAEFGFSLFAIATFLDASVRSDSDYGITEHINNVAQRGIISSILTVWGYPADPSHDYWRGVDPNHGCDGHGAFSCEPVSVSVAPKPLLTLPTSCAGPQTVTLRADTWEDTNVKSELSTLTHDSQDTPVGFTGCEHLSFAPALSLAPDTANADTPAGLTVDVRPPTGGLSEVEGLSASDLQDTKVVLPAGVAINPGQAAGLESCSNAQSGVGTDGPASCPSASKVGTVSIETPLLTDRLEGGVYVLQSNPPDLKLLVAASAEGVNVKLVGDVHLDEATGQLTTTFESAPELPFTDFKLAFSGGAQAALATPTKCGTYTSNADFASWSSPLIADYLEENSFQITSGTNGAPCPGSPLPFSPALTAGSTTDQAGGFTNFSMLLQAPDDQQRIEKLQFKVPQGLLGMIRQVPLCGEPQAAQGTCSSASQIGHTVVASGPGPYPLVVPQPGQPPAAIYLTGPYEGAPFGLSIVVPVHVGPFTLPTQIVRAKIEVDPLTAQITVTTDPLPQMIDGVPTDLRTVNAVIDRPGFMFNPTNCAPMSFSGTAWGTPPPGVGGPGSTAAISSPFQMGSCRALLFKPNFKVSTSGKTSRKNGASLDAKIVYPRGLLGANQASSQSNLRGVKVDLPKQLPSRLTTLQKACTSQVFVANPADCPADSRVGTASAVTPVLPVELTGPAYFVSYGGAKFPELVFILQGYGVSIQVHGETFINKAGITSSTFHQVPDVPIYQFELKLPEGPFSALAANGNLCNAKLKMPTSFTAQDGAVIHQTTAISVTGCAKQKPKKKSKAKHETKKK